MNMRKLIMAGMVASLAACTSEPVARRETVENMASGPIAENSSAPMANEIAAAADPDRSVSSESAGAATIPAAFHGRWGMNPADCTSTRGDAKGLLIIDGTSLKFYESVAVPREMEIVSPTEWRAILDYTGEGQKWSERTVMTLRGDGKRLGRMADGPWSYQRCENQP